MRWLIAAVVSLLTTTFVGLAAASGSLYWQRVETRGEQSARAALPPLATQEIPEVFAYDYQTVERSLGAAYLLLTPAYRQSSRRAPTRRSSPRHASVRSSCRRAWSAWE